MSSSYCLFEVFFLSSDWPLLLCCRLSRAHSIYGTKISDTGSVTSGSLEHLVTHSDLEITCVTGHLRGPVSKLYSLQLSKQIPTRHNYIRFSGITVERFWRRNSHGYIHTSYEPTNDNELCLAKGQIVQDIVRVDDKEGWYEVKIGQTEMLSSALCIYLHPRGLEIPIISSHTATNRSMSDQHKLIQPMSEIWRHFDKGKNPSVRAS